MVTEETAFATGSTSSRNRDGKRDRRDITGVVILDKPVGLTSNQALQAVKRLFRARKAGHTGSLDPLASGVLPVCLGQATKISTYLLGANKHYRVTAKLGIKTDTGDADGEIVKRLPVTNIDSGRWLKVMAEFTGELEQVPPMYSALKHKGQPLYKLARQGVEVDRKSRPITIYEMSLVGMEGDTVEIDVHCSKGTYVRTLLEDMAESLGTVAHVSALRRLGVGPYTVDLAVTLQDLETLAGTDPAALDGILLGADSAISDWPKAELPANSAFYLTRGQPVSFQGIGQDLPRAGLVRIYDENGRFLGVGEIVPDKQIAPRRLFLAQT